MDLKGLGNDDIANAFINNGSGVGGFRLTDLLLSANPVREKDGEFDPANRSLNLWDRIPRCESPKPCQSSDSHTAEFDASSVTTSFQFTQSKPNGAKGFENSLLSEVIDYSIDNFGQKNDKRENLPPRADGLLENIVESTSPSISISTEKSESNSGTRQELDLNKAPRLKASKRRKHKPKVIIEGKPKKAPKTPKKTDPQQNSQEKRKYVRKNKNANPKMPNPQEKPQGKRKYVWRNGTTKKLQQNTTKEITPEILDVSKDTPEPPYKSAAISYRKVLNFDPKETCDDEMGNVLDQSANMHKISNINRNLNSSIQDIESCTTTSSISGSKSALQISQHNEKMIKIFQANLNPSVDQIPNQCASQFPMSDAKFPQAIVGGLHMNNVIASRAAQNGNAGPYNGDTSRHRHINAVQTSDAVGDSERSRQQMDSPYLFREMFQRCKRSANGLINDIGFSEVRKKTKLESGVGKDMSFRSAYVSNGGRLNHFKSTHNGIMKTATRPKMMGMNQVPLRDVKANGFLNQINGQNMENSMGIHSDQNRNNDFKKFIRDMYVKSIMARLQRQQSSSESLYFKGKGGRIPNGSTPYYNPQATSNNLGKLLTCPSQTTARTNYGKILGMNHVSLSSNQPVKGVFSYPSSLNVKRIMPCKYSLNEHSIQATGPLVNKKHPVSIDEVIYKLRDLNLNRERNGSAVNGRSALVPYKGEGPIVPYRDYLKKRLLRPKVDLDEETTRVWKLLMEEGSNDNEEMNKDTEKYWKRERGVFCGRVDSFIARMHLVQGDRRFSRWKGSVVDSVIGVFLTQNVSDHLSSSAFMSLAAHFPFQPTDNNITPFRDESNLMVEGTWLSTVHRNETIKWSGKLPCQLTYHNSYTGMREAGEKNENSIIPIIGENVEVQKLRIDEEAISSQDSFDPAIINISSTIRSCSGSNSEAEDSASVHNQIHQTESSSSVDLQHGIRIDNGGKFYLHDNGSPLVYETYMQGQNQLGIMDDCMQKMVSSERVDNPKSPFTATVPVRSTQAEAPSPHNHWLHITPDLGQREVSRSNTWGEEINSSSISTATGRTIEKANCLNKGGQMAEHIGKTMYQPIIQKNIYPNSEEPLEGVVLSKKYALCQEQFLLNNAVQKSPHVIKPAEENHLDGIPPGNKQAYLEDNGLSPDFREHPLSPDNAYSTTKTTSSKVNKTKADSNAKSTKDWESLRSQVHSNYIETERSSESVDKLDYEAMKNARVDEISAIIRARGMNNLLAERIMDFLHRLVKDHGNIDLEWLKDAPPDKAKEFLLSIRGLGLKSVECVRLLTLHHLAFPVDTNVGRIAVRLGWVPLQPLPESLQLHLLELYPVLESIQKYLWPRLCKMDQRTLYELHYQMITFGKVFCTKSKPNCNACPMRAECRHFASAFASARLALPGPEEKSIVNPLVHTAFNKQDVVINHLPLPSSEKDLNRVQEAVGKCEPIIEVPATPEPEGTYVWDNDIEDVFYQDPDEIPTIQLNIEEFTTNLQAYIKERKMDLQEGNMSKAVVAIHPAAASIPTPKLKNVNRLRTEHQVYELPDLHPCLNGMDKREPDDPSPYLLAIWTPGETVNSIQQPETSCASQESGKLCNKDTCYSCNSIRESNLQTVRGTILIPCRTAMRGSFPLNGTYFQVNEVFADHHSSLSPIDVPRAWIWNLTRRTVFFGTSVSTIFRGLTTEEIQYCFWRGFVCVRGFDQIRRAPRPLIARLHFPISKLQKLKTDKQATK